ncbi:MAG: hypothetical protein K0S18_360 [Anaerocolumna sp.]|jgi:hypothetical protein|nr:hypothetical protein [Anaerocolumna sp.]
MLVSKFPTGVKIYTDQVSGLSVNPVSNTPGSLTVSWTNPTSKKYVGTMIRYKAGSYPTSPTDGTQAYLGTGTSCTITGLTGGTKYYVRAFAKAANTSGTKIFYNVETTGAQDNDTTCASPVTNLAVAKTSASSLTISWTSPVLNYMAVRIVRKASGYPTSPTDGTVIYEGTATSKTDIGLTANTAYYYRAFVYNGSIWNTATTGQQGTNTTKIASGQVIFTSSQSWIVPVGVTKVDAFAVGGGAGAGYNGGGGGYTATKLNISVTPGSAITVTVGSGSAAAYTNGSAQGGSSSFGSHVSAAGGKGCTYEIVSYDGSTYYTYVGGDGGSGAGTSANSNIPATPPNGGSDGSNGGGPTMVPGYSLGQGTTTRAFATAGATLYAGGGAGISGNGGAGGGGNPGVSGTPNTGGGGGGNYNTTASGGSGIVIVRWAEQ